MNNPSFLHHAVETSRLLWENGVLVAERTEGFYSKKLYQSGHRYFEVTWHLHFNVVVKVGSFTHTDYLEPYLNNISLEGLVT